MISDAWRLPWTSKTTPHAVLDVNRGCNIVCRACYNALPPANRPPAAVAADLDALITRRRLDSVSIVGGEPLLHPGLCEIVRLVKQRGLVVEVCTNGLLLGDALLRQLKEAGADMIFVHADSGQRRPDLPHPCTPEQLRELWTAKAALIAAHGIDIGLSVTAFPDNMEEVNTVVDFTLRSPHVNYLLVTHCRDMSHVRRVTGDLDTGLFAEFLQPPSVQPSSPTPNLAIRQMLERRFNLRPFDYIGSNLDADDPRWLSYFVGSVRRADGTMAFHAIRASRFEPFALWCLYRRNGRYPMYRRQDTRQLASQLVLNGLFGGDRQGNAAFRAALRQPGATTLAKRLLFQCPAEPSANGTIIHCEPCPDAVLQGGRLCPVCICDTIKNSAPT